MANKKQLQSKEETILRILGRAAQRSWKCNRDLVKMTGLPYRQVVRITNKLNQEGRITLAGRSFNPLYWRINTEGRTKRQ